MVNQTHHFTFSDSGARSAGDECHAQAVEAVLGQADAFEKRMPRFGRHGRHVAGGFAVGVFEACEKGNEFIAHRDGKDFISLFVKGDAFAVGVYVALQVENGGAKPAAGVKADLESDAHPFRFCGKFSPDDFKVAIGDVGFFFRIFAADAHRGGRVIAGKSAADRLAHQRRKEFNLKQRGVVVSFEDAKRAIAFGSEGEIFGAVNVGELGWELNFLFGEEGFEIFPGKAVAQGALLLFAVAGGQVAGDPARPAIVLSAGRGFEFDAALFVGEEFGFAGSLAIVDPKLGGFPFYLTGAVAVFDPPIVRVFSLVDGGHAIVCAETGNLIKGTFWAHYFFDLLEVVGFEVVNKWWLGAESNRRFAGGGVGGWERVFFGFGGWVSELGWAHKGTFYFLIFARAGDRGRGGFGFSLVLGRWRGRFDTQRSSNRQAGGRRSKRVVRSTGASMAFQFRREGRSQGESHKLILRRFNSAPCNHRGRRAVAVGAMSGSRRNLRACAARLVFVNTGTRAGFKAGTRPRTPKEISMRSRGPAWAALKTHASLSRSSARLSAMAARRRGLLVVPRREPTGTRNSSSASGDCRLPARCRRSHGISLEVGQ